MEQDNNQILEGLKYIWQIPGSDSLTNSQMLQYCAKYNVSLPIIQTLFSRGISKQEELDSYLFSIFERDVADPCLLKDALKAVERIERAIETGEKILICGDYDVDGITSSALMLICLLPLGAKINFFLPNRVRDGYGLSVKTVERAAQNNYKVLITVDNGITAFEPARRAKELGLDLIITDHHKPHDELPDAYAIINPQRNDCPYPYKTFAGVGVGFKVLSLLYKRLNREMPPKVYELLLLGTVADVVPLTGENRYWVRHGLKLVNKFESLSLKVLKQNSRVSKPVLSSTDIGFFITPQINALGRLEDARQGVGFLIGVDQEEVARTGQVLAHLNQARKNVEREIIEHIEKLIQDKQVDPVNQRVIIVGSDNWAPGVIGLVASRIAGTYNRPTLLFHLTKDGLAKGSCRSASGINIFELLHEHKEILISFGGHSFAAGLALPADKLTELKERLEKSIIEKYPVVELKPKLILDAQVTLPEVNKKLISDLSLLEPFGNENTQPVFYVKDVHLIEQPVLLKDAHVKCKIFSQGVIKPVIFFNRPELYSILVDKKDDTFTMAVQVVENHWQSRVSVELQGLDVLL